MTPTEFKSLREYHGLTQRQMAAALGLGAKNGYRTVQRYESGEIHIEGTVLRVCEYIVETGIIIDDE